VWEVAVGAVEAEAVVAPGGWLGVRGLLIGGTWQQGEAAPGPDARLGEASAGKGERERRWLEGETAE
jgi:hypothetical protein